MVYTPSALAIAATALLAAVPAQAGLYPKSSKVLQITGKNYDRLIAQSNHTSIVEFYAPWCGHCKNLQPAYEKAAGSLEGLAKVAAVDCDEESNKAFCGGFGVQGFPTLKIVRPGKKPGKPVVEDYNGPRTAKGIVDAVVEKIPNHVQRVDDKTLESWLAESKDLPKAILFTDKGKTSALIKSVAIEFKDSITVAQIRDKEKASVELFGITKFPTLILLPGGKEAAEGIKYEGELKKAGIVEFLTKTTNIEANPDPAPPKVKVKDEKSKKPKPSKKTDASKEKEKFESASASQASSEGAAGGPSATDETIVEGATESPEPVVEAEKPIIIPDPAPPIGILISSAELEKECLGPKTGTCILALLPPTPDAVVSTAVGSLSEISHRHKLHKRQIFPFYALPESNEGYATIKNALGLADFDVIAINAKRGWWRKLPTKGDKIAESDVGEEALENWVDAIRLGEASKSRLPAGLVPEEPEEPASVEAEVPVVEETPEAVKEGEQVVDKTAEPHDEL
ncbi:hypothetical protein B0O99DRAFT_518344 [Bisporella sp. PMI_857]|nr:hypothetical protein B0O99DRAFT_518344 [Bisporella sp. PMI_857]